MIRPTDKFREEFQPIKKPSDAKHNNKKCSKSILERISCFVKMDWLKIHVSK